jgi:hypothetical protein
MQQSRGSVLLITHKRVTELRQVIESLESAWINDYKVINIILHKDAAHIMKEIEKIPVARRNIIEVDRSDSINSRSAINSNVHDGLRTAFLDSEIDFVTVIEDDICVRKDFLRFNAEIVYQNLKNRDFMGINGFSAAEFKNDQDDVYGKFRYGFGWGWTISRSTWNKLLDFWSGNENVHWDAYIETFLKTGYVIMPHNCRILNLGFGETATHTREIPEIAVQMEKSLLDVKNPTVHAKLREEIFSVNWRKDCLVYIDGDSPFSKLISKLFKNQYLISKTGRNFPRLRPMLAKFIGLFERTARVLTHICINSYLKNYLNKF